MTKIQFRVLYREFLFRVVDLDLLAPQGDIAKLLGQFVAVLICLSAIYALGAVFFPTPLTAAVVWGPEHSLIALTMLVVGLFAVLSWDSAFPDRRDVLVLAPLPVRSRTLFLSKVAALTTALSLTVVALNALSGLTWPMNFVVQGSGFGGLMRSLAAYWITMFAAGAFIFSCVLGLHGLAAQLPRRRYLRISALLQMAAFGLLLSMYFLQPTLTTPRALADLESQHLLKWLPSYWFFGLFQVLNGSAPSGSHAQITWLSERALLGLTITASAAGTAFLLSYFRTLRKIVEEPDIVPGRGSMRVLPRFGNSFTTAIVHFSIRTLLRSRQHRVILAFYLGLGLAVVILLKQAPVATQGPLQGSASATIMLSSFLMLCCSIAGARVVFGIPLQLKGNWIFRIMPLPGSRKSLNGIRRSLLVLAVAPVWTVSAIALLAAWPWQLAAGHLIVLGFLGLILADSCLAGFQKIPFTCSYLPGKSPAQRGLLTVWSALFVAWSAIGFERRALADIKGYALMIGILCIIAAGIRWRAIARASSPGAALQFEETEAPAIFALDLHRDGRFQK